MTTYTCNNERYTPEAIEFASIEEFQAYCAAIFDENDEMPQLNEQPGNGIVVDETGETVLTMKEPVVVVTIPQAFGYTSKLLTVGNQGK